VDLQVDHKLRDKDQVEQLVQELKGKQELKDKGQVVDHKLRDKDLVVVQHQVEVVDLQVEVEEDKDHQCQLEEL